MRRAWSVSRACIYDDDEEAEEEDSAPSPLPTPQPPPRLRGRHFQCCIGHTSRSRPLVGAVGSPDGSVDATRSVSPAWSFSRCPRGATWHQGHPRSRSGSPGNSKRIRGYGVVVGPSWHRNEVLVRGAHPLSEPLSVPVKNIKRHRLVGDFKIGDVVESKVDFERASGERITVGDVGVVLGPSTSTNLKEAALRICCRFRGMVNVNLAAGQVHRTSLPGGFRVGTCVVCLEWTPRRRDGIMVRTGEIGSVEGPAADPRMRRSHVECSFSEYPSIDMPISQIAVAPPLPDGFKVNDTVSSLVSFRRQSGDQLRAGDLGTVLGPPVGDSFTDTEAAPRALRRMACSFPNMPLVNLHPSQVERRQLPGLLKVNDTIVSYTRLPQAGGHCALPVQVLLSRFHRAPEFPTKVATCSSCGGAKIDFCAEEVNELMCDCARDLRICWCR